MFSFGGLASGLDTASIVKQLVLLESRPLFRLEDRRDSLSSQQSQFSDFRSKLTALENSIKDLGNVGELSLFSTSSSDDALVGISAGEGAAEGDYSVVVTNKAKAQSTAFVSPFADTNQTPWGAGQIGINVGNNEYTAVDIDDDDTLVDIRDKINASGASVNASIINDGTNYQLVLTAEKEGVENGFLVAATGLANAGALQGGLLVAPEDAALTINGLAVTSPTNDIDTAIQGVTLDIKNVTAGATVELSVKKDADAIAERLQKFVDEYNGLVSYIDKQNGTGSDDVGLRSIKLVLQRAFQGSLDSADGFSRTAFAQIGLKTDGGGKIKIDRDDLDEIVEEDFQGLLEFFSGKLDGSADGIAKSFEVAFRGQTGVANSVGILTSGTGSLAAREQGIRDRIRQLDDQITRAQERITRFEEQQNRKFAAFEELTAQFQAQGSALSSIFG